MTEPPVTGCSVTEPPATGPPAPGAAVIDCLAGGPGVAATPAAGAGPVGVERAEARLARPELVPVVDELARRFAESAEARPARLTLRSLGPSTRRALADLLGSDRLPAADMRLRVDRLATALGVADQAALRAVVERLRGTLADKRADRTAARAARDELWSWLSAGASRIDVGTGTGRLDRWVAGLRAGGIRGGPAAFRVRLEIVLRVLRALPADGVSLAGFASDRAGDPHALDHGSAVATIVLDAVADALGQPRPADAEAARAGWESVGVVPDPVSSTVLALGVPGSGARTPLASWLAAAAGDAEPVVLTLANLRRWPLAALPSTARLFVVENPSLVVEAASRRWRGPPIVCSSGRPTVAVTTLIRQLTAGGAVALQHTDFDAAGLSITAWLANRVGTTPWRMAEADYLAGVAGDGPPPMSVGPFPGTPWDPPLQVAMARAGRPLFEERLRAELLDAMCRPA